METAVATPAQNLSAPFALTDVEDLNDADFDGVLADAGAAVASAGALAALVGRGPGQDAVLAHTSGARALLLAIR